MDTDNTGVSDSTRRVKARQESEVQKSSHKESESARRKEKRQGSEAMPQQQAYIARVRVRLALALRTAVALDGHRNCFRALQLGWLAEDIEAVVLHGWLTVQFVLEDLECLPPNGMLTWRQEHADDVKMRRETISRCRGYMVCEHADGICCCDDCKVSGGRTWMHSGDEDN